MDESKFDVDVGWYFEDGYWWNSKTIPLDLAKTARALQLRDTDILSCTFPKTGQTWLLAILALIRNADKLERGEEFVPSMLRDALFLELKLPDEMKIPPAHLRAPKLPGSRLFKSHLPLTYWKNALDKCPEIKIIQTFREPKDTLVSLYHFMKMTLGLGSYKGTWDDFFDMVKSDKIPHGGYFRFNAEWFEYNKNRENSLILFYEDMKRDLRGEIKKISDFLGADLSAKVIDLITEKTTFKNMAKDSSLNPKNADLPIQIFKNKEDCLLRKGEVGEWRKYMNEEQVKFVDEQTEKWLAPVGLKFE